MEEQIGFLGAGRMGGAILGRLAEETDARLSVLEPRLAELPDLLALVEGGRVISCDNVLDLQSASDVMMLCVKPQDLQSAVAELDDRGRYISIAAGIPTARLREWIGPNIEVARVMPNISALVGASVSGIFSPDESLWILARRIFEHLGHVHRISGEDMMHAFTALCGSGPAFVCEFIEGLTRGARDSGIEPDLAREWALDTLEGTIRLLKATETTPTELRDRVASPGGTTVAGLEALYAGGFAATTSSAITAASKRSRELGG